MKTKTSILALTKAFFILLVSVCFCSCDTLPENKTNGVYYKTIVVDSCEYVWFKDKSSYGQCVVHKPTCKFCKQRSLK